MFIKHVFGKHQQTFDLPSSRGAPLMEHFEPKTMSLDRCLFV